MSRIKAYKTENGRVSLDPLPLAEELEIELERGYIVLPGQMGARRIYGVSPYGMTVDQAVKWGVAMIIPVPDCTEDAASCDCAYHENLKAAEESHEEVIGHGTIDRQT